MMRKVYQLYQLLSRFIPTCYSVGINLFELSGTAVWLGILQTICSSISLILLK